MVSGNRPWPIKVPENHVYLFCLDCSCPNCSSNIRDITVMSSVIAASSSTFISEVGITRTMPAPLRENGSPKLKRSSARFLDSLDKLFSPVFFALSICSREASICDRAASICTSFSVVSTVPTCAGSGVVGAGAGWGGVETAWANARPVTVKLRMANTVIVRTKGFIFCSFHYVFFGVILFVLNRYVFSGIPYQHREVAPDLWFP